MTFDTLRYVFLFGTLVATLWSILHGDIVFVAGMAGSFGFQLALVLVDRSSAEQLRRRRSVALKDQKQ